MNNNVGTTDMPGYVADLIERVTELERKVLVLGDDPPGDGGCCTVLCCDSTPGQTLATGEQVEFCSRTLEDTAGNATRIVIVGFVTLTAVTTGQAIWDLAACVDSQAYLYRPRYNRAMVAGDEATLTVVNTIDTNSTAPVVSLKVRNLNLISLTVEFVNLAAFVYGVREGSAACGESAGTS